MALGNVTPNPVRRVLMTADTDDGLWTQSMELCRALGHYGVDITLVTMGGTPRVDQREEVSRLSNVRFFPSPYKQEWMPDPWDDVDRAGEWLMELEAERRPEVIHLNSFAHGALSWKAPVVVVGHSSMLSWWGAVKQQPPPEEWKEYARRAICGLHGADMVVAPSQAMLRALRESHGLFPRGRVIYGGRSLALSIGRKADIVFSVGRLCDEAKNLRVLNAAASHLSWPVYVAGDDVPPAEGTGVQFGQLRRLGHLSQDELGGWLSRASIYALPSRYEPFGLSALEAGLAGCALVLGDIASLREVWGDSAIFVNPDSSNALREAIEFLIENVELRHAYGIRARERAKRYTADRMASEYVRTYHMARKLQSARTYQIV